MRQTEAVLTGLAVALAVVLAYWAGGHARKKGAADGFAAGAAAAADGFAAAPPAGANPYPHASYEQTAHYNPYTVLNKQIDEIRGYRNDGYNQLPVYRQRDGIDRFHRTGRPLRPEQIAEAEREEWYAAGTADGFTSTFNTELAHDAPADTVQYHAPSVPLDYDTYLTDLVADPRIRDNHSRWVEEMKPWSGTLHMVDTLDLEPTLDFRGLRRPQAVAQYNPLQLTEIDTYDLTPNPKFNFK